MANLTIAFDDALLKRARIRALEQGSSVNALLRGYLEAFANPGNTRERAIRSFQALADRAQSGSAGRSWTRDQLHER